MQTLHRRVSPTCAEAVFKARFQATPLTVPCMNPSLLPLLRLHPQGVTCAATHCVRVKLPQASALGA